jgi:hypothetical protein
MAAARKQRELNLVPDCCCGEGYISRSWKLELNSGVCVEEEMEEETRTQRLSKVVH